MGARGEDGAHGVLFAKFPVMGDPLVFQDRQIGGGPRWRAFSLFGGKQAVVEHSGVRQQARPLHVIRAFSRPAIHSHADLRAVRTLEAKQGWRSQITESAVVIEERDIQPAEPGRPPESWPRSRAAKGVRYDAPRRSERPIVFPAFWRDTECGSRS